MIDCCSFCPSVLLSAGHACGLLSLVSELLQGTVAHVSLGTSHWIFSRPTRPSAAFLHWVTGTVGADILACRLARAFVMVSVVDVVVVVLVLVWLKCTGFLLLGKGMAVIGHLVWNGEGALRRVFRDGLRYPLRRRIALNNFASFLWMGGWNGNYWKWKEKINTNNATELLIGKLTVEIFNLI